MSRPLARAARVALATASVAVAASPVFAAPAHAVDDAVPDSPSAQPLTFALIGDTPYGDAQRAVFPALVDDVNRDPEVRFVLHAGDVKNGSSTCDDGRFADLAGLFDTFADPFVLTPGDNEWTDCHRTAAGSYLPTERLAAVRRSSSPTRAGRPVGVPCRSRRRRPTGLRRLRRERPGSAAG